MNRRPRRNINTELHELEQDLVALTLRVATIRNQVNQRPTTGNQRPTTDRRLPSIGDRVRFRITGYGNAEGVIISITTHRIRIRQDETNHIFLRAYHNVTVL
jgi:transcription elongation factor